MRSTFGALLILALAAGAAMPACFKDPVHNTDVSNLGPERGNADEYHRAGQPCVVCHGSEGPASTQFSVAGTIFSQPGDLVGVQGAQVELTDSAGTKYIATTNCVGNFYVKPSDWDPHFPILVRVAKGGVSRTMTSPIGREPSCGKCHDGHLPNRAPLYLVDHVYLFASDEPTLPACPVSPDIGGGL
jgi:hypothetical protein